MSHKNISIHWKRVVSVLLGYALLSSLLGLAGSASVMASIPSEPHLPLNQTDMSTYLRLRDEAIARLRGLPYSDPGVRARAIQLMEHQEHLMQVGQAPQRSASTWTSIGPAPIPNGQTAPSVPVSGRVTAIAIHPTNPNIVYVGTAQGGLYRTLDGGSTWTPLMDTAQTLAIGAVTIDPLNPSTVFVGTGEGNSSLDSFFGVGLYRITTADTAPVLAGPFETRIAGTGTVTGTGHAFLGTSINTIVVDPANDNRIFVGNTWGFSGRSGDFAATMADLGLYFSPNALAGSPTFSRVSGLPGGGNGAVTDIVFEPGSSNNLLVGELDVTFTGANDGIYRTTNASVASQSPSISPVFTRTYTPGTYTNFKLAINKVGITVTVVAPNGYSGGGSLLKSTDGGQTWPTTLTSLGAPGSGFCDGQCWYDIAVAMDPTDANKIYLGGAAVSTNSSILVKSIDGTTFARSEASLHPDEHAMAVAPSDPSIVYTGNDGGVWKSANFGATWTSLNNATFNATQFESLAVHPSDRNFTIGGTQDNGTNWYKPDGTWTRADYGDGGFALIDQNAVNTTTVTMYHTYYNQTNNLIGLARVLSTTNASDGNWSFLGCGGTPNGINCGDNVLFYAPMALGPGNPNTLYFGTDRLYRSTNQGTNMTVVSQAPFVSGKTISAIGISPQNDNVRIVGLQNGKVYATTTGSTSLTDVTTTTMPTAYVARAVIDPNDSNTAYVTFDGYGFTHHIWRTTQLSTGASAWLPTNFSVDVPVNAFVVDPANSQHLYAGTDIGVYASIDGGNSWVPFGTGLPRVAVFDMAIQLNNHILRIATHGRGLWEIGLIEDTPIANLNASNSSPTALSHSTAFTATISTGSNVSYAWNFGDGIVGATSAISTATHTYASVGQYTARVTATNSISTVFATTPVTVTDAPISGLSASNNSPTLVNHVTALTATISAGSNVLYTWNFGDSPVLDYGASVSHTYTAWGNFTATVTATNSLNTVMTTTPILIMPYRLFLPLTLKNF